MASSFLRSVFAPLLIKPATSPPPGQQPQPPWPLHRKDSWKNVKIPHSRTRRLLLLLIPLLLLLQLVSRYYVQNSTTLQHHDNLSKELSNYLKFIQTAHPEFTTLSLENEGIEYRRNIVDVYNNTERLDILHLSEKEFLKTRMAHEFVVEYIPQYEKISKYTAGSRGIVTIGGEKYTAQLLVQLRMLRRTGSKLPVEVFLPTTNKENNIHLCKTLLPQFNARCIDLPTNTASLGFTLSRFSYKALALLLSTFEDNLFLDADNFPITDPSPLLSSEPYLSTGLVTWPDHWVSTTSPIFYFLIRKPTPPLTFQASTESGQILISKRKHVQTLLLVLYYCVFGGNGYFTLLGQGGHGTGDKDTWIHAALALDNPYYQVREAVWPLGGEVMEWFYTGVLQSHPGEDYARQLKEPEEGFRVNTTGANGVFIHHNWVKLNPAHVVVERKRRTDRLWGKKERTIEKFGWDLEREVWEDVLYVGCVLEEWLPNKDDRGRCKTLKGIWGRVMVAQDKVKKGEVKRRLRVATDKGGRLCPDVRGERGEV